MKKIITTLLFGLFILVGNAQNDLYCVVNFENNNTCYTDYLWRDTISDTNNIWQIGSPQKNIFNSAYSQPYAIVTDTINYYPVNDTSSFIIVHIAEAGLWCPMLATLQGYFKVESDSINDYGSIKFSPNNGITWIDLLNDTIFEQYHTTGPPDLFTGNSNGWQYFYFHLENLGPVFNIQEGDTTLFRFTFISDSIQTFKDGLMFDDLILEDECQSIAENNMSFFASSIFPNPAINSATIEFKNISNSSFMLRIFDITGRIFFEKATIKTNRIELNTQNLPPGIYQYQLLSEKEQKQSMGKFVVN